MNNGVLGAHRDQTVKAEGQRDDLREIHNLKQIQKLTLIHGMKATSINFTHVDPCLMFRIERISPTELNLLRVHCTNALCCPKGQPCEDDNRESLTS